MESEMMGEEDEEKKPAARQQEDMEDDAEERPPNAAAGAVMTMPRRFKTAYILFSSEKHKEIRQQLGQPGNKVKTPDISQLVSRIWLSMRPEEKEEWEEKARQDKERYDAEMEAYRERVKQSGGQTPVAPKRPMSAYLAFSNKRRGAFKKEHPNATNAELSKMLAKAWKEAPPNIRAEYIDDEAKLREKYKMDITPWRCRKKPRSKKWTQAKAKGGEMNKVTPPMSEDQQHERGMLLPDDRFSNSAAASLDAAYQNQQLASAGMMGSASLAGQGGYSFERGSNRLSAETGRFASLNEQLMMQLQPLSAMSAYGDPSLYAPDNQTSNRVNSAALQLQPSLSGYQFQNHSQLLQQQFLLDQAISDRNHYSRLVASYYPQTTSATLEQQHRLLQLTPATDQQLQRQLDFASALRAQASVRDNNNPNFLSASSSNQQQDAWQGLLGGQLPPVPSALLRRDSREQPDGTEREQTYDDWLQRHLRG